MPIFRVIANTGDATHISLPRCLFGNRFLLGAQGQIHHASPSVEQCSHRNVPGYPFLLFDVSFLFQCLAAKDSYGIRTRMVSSGALRVGGLVLLVLYSLYGDAHDFGLSRLFL